MIRWFASIVLLGASVLKAVQLITQPETTAVHRLGRYFLPLEIGLEFAVGLLILSGFYWRTMRWLVLLLFAAFAGFSLYFALTGATSCGCFGPLRVKPWWSMWLDVMVVTGLLISIVIERQPNGVGPGVSQLLRPSTTLHRRTAVATIISISIVSTTLMIRYANKRPAMVGEVSSTIGEVAILEPEKWIGQKLPIAQSVDVDLSRGEWVVLLHRHDCPECEKVIPRYEERAATGERVAIVEVPPYGNILHRAQACEYGRLKNDREWFVQTPVEIRLHDGLVTAVNSD